MEDRLDSTDFLKIIKNINSTIQDNKDYLTKLDLTIGDGDHGVTIARGFRSAAVKLEESKPNNISELLKTTGFTLLSSMGGASGPIFGSFFTQMAKVAAGKEELGLDDIYKMFLAVLDNEPKLGGAKPGDKTMIDALYPAVKSLKDSLRKNLSIKEALKEASTAAKKGAESTKDMVAKKGRSRYHGKRSLGYQDAGATSLSLIIKSMYEAI